MTEGREGAEVKMKVGKMKVVVGGGNDGKGWGNGLEGTKNGKNVS